MLQAADFHTPRRPPVRQLARVAPQQMVEGISELPTVLTSFETLDEAQQLLDESGPFAQLFVWPPFYVISILGIIVGTNSAWRRDARPRVTHGSLPTQECRSRRNFGSTRSATRRRTAMAATRRCVRP